MHGSSPCRRSLIQSEMNGMLRPQITAVDCRLSFLTSAFTHNSPLSQTYPMIPALGHKVEAVWISAPNSGMNLKPPLSDFLCLCPVCACVCVCVCVECERGFRLYHRIGEGKENTATASFPKLSSHKWGIIASRRVRVHLSLQWQLSLLKNPSFSPPLSLPVSPLFLSPWKFCLPLLPSHSLFGLSIWPCYCSFCQQR